MEKSTLTTANKYLNTENLLQVYSKYRNDDTFLLGYFMETMGSYLIFQSIDEYGALDGYTLLAKSDIADIITDTNYTTET
ncbi:hypothetical protein PT285_00715 [Lactobacillus sp. ESL0791]|uniref:hypothetical protein n=1 Tax=Lactobacillus sp. ESL0791 TaxID=2983234 RepID=UPI0023F8DBC7|nr:hypothetical protein [Lactobacillus sp. ESL0791]MDF7637960.1 hypothetical protein [Lactobacillus sp. ESL0791]